MGALRKQVVIATEPGSVSLTGKNRRLIVLELLLFTYLLITYSFSQLIQMI